MERRWWLQDAVAAVLVTLVVFVGLLAWASGGHAEDIRDLTSRVEQLEDGGCGGAGR